MVNAAFSFSGLIVPVYGLNISLLKINYSDYRNRPGPTAYMGYQVTAKQINIKQDKKKLLGARTAII